MKYLLKRALVGNKKINTNSFIFSHKNNLSHFEVFKEIELLNDSINFNLFDEVFYSITQDGEKILENIFSIKQKYLDEILQRQEKSSSHSFLLGHTAD